MPPRKFHTKNRFGCETCKRRKVRCGLEKPICRNCSRLKKRCSYPNHVLIGDGPAAYLPSAFNQNLPVQSLELMHYYTSITCSSMADEDNVTKVWQTDIPRLAFKHEFLLHGLLALAALHRHHNGELSSQTNLINQARNHQHEALNSYIPRLRNINQENCHSLFALAAVLGSLSYAFLQHAERDVVGQAFIERFVDSAELLRGSTTVAEAAKEWVLVDKLLPWLRSEAFDFESTERLHSMSENAIASISDLVLGYEDDQENQSESDGSSSQAEVLMQTLQSLARILPRAEGSKLPLSQIIGWPVKAGISFTSLVREKNPPALVLLAIYGVVLHINKNVWYLERLGSRLVCAAYATLGGHWKIALKKVVQTLLEEDDILVQILNARCEDFRPHGNLSHL